MRVSRKCGSLLALCQLMPCSSSAFNSLSQGFPLIPRFVRTASIPHGLAIPPLLSLRLYAHFVNRCFQKLQTIPLGNKLSAKIGLKRRWQRLVGSEFSLILLHCAPLERRDHACVQILPQDFLESIADTLPLASIDEAYPGGYNGTPKIRSMSSSKPIPSTMNEKCT